jgi:hypothetical protein
MSRIILKKYDNGEDQYVVGWDRPCASYFWQHFQKEPEVAETGEGKWKVTSPVHKVRVYATKAEADEHQWDDWQEMLAYKGYMPSELATMQMFIDSLPPAMLDLVTEDVKRILQEHSQNPPDIGNIVVDMTTSNVVLASYKVEVRTFGSESWASNAVRFATEDEASQAGMDLAGRWTMLDKWRVAPSADAVNYRWQDGKAVSV